MKSAERQNNFNLLRFTLALLVLFGHSPELIDGDRSREWLTQTFGSISFGELAVDGFFLLSGYLIAQSWHSQPKAWPFLKKRLLRIYPGFIVASLICALLVGPLAANSSIYFASFELLTFLTGLAFLSVPIVPEVFSGTPYPLLNGAMWTISKEFVCYLFVLAAGVAGVFRARYACLIPTIAVFGMLVVFKLQHLTVPVDLRLASFFLSGVCYFQFRDKIKMNGHLAVVSVVITVLALFSWRAAELVLATVGGYALLYAASKRSVVLSQFNRLPDISYGLYLYGWPIQKMLLWNIPSLSPWELFGIAAPTAIMFGMASWYLIEKPALRFKGPSLAAAAGKSYTG
jgi:peptidoglycan/LPS O-acetylase OafA/YrhL